MRPRLPVVRTVQVNVRDSSRSQFYCQRSKTGGGPRKLTLIHAACYGDNALYSLLASHNNDVGCPKYFFNFSSIFCSQYKHYCSLLGASFLIKKLCLLLPPPHLQQQLVPTEGLCIWVQTKHDVEVTKWVLFLRYSLGLRPVEERGRGGGGEGGRGGEREGRGGGEGRGEEIFSYFKELRQLTHNK